MADIRQPQEMRTEAMRTEAGTGWSRTTLVEPGGGLPMRAERWRLEPGSAGSTGSIGAETMCYVIAGSGTARVGETTYALEPETVIWMTAGDHVWLRAGAEGLEVLVGAAGEPQP